MEEVEKRLASLKYGENVTPEEKVRFEEIFHKYIHVFAFSYKDLKEVTLEQHKIELQEGAQPVRQKQRRVNPTIAETVKEEIEKLRSAGFIYEVENSEWVPPIVVVKKKNGKLRVCVDYKKLNAVTRKDYYPLPFIDEILEEVAGHEWYSFGDGYSGYNQLRIFSEHQHLTTFTTPWGTFAFRVMPFGLCNAPATFQRFMNKIFEPFLGKFVRDFIDDFCVYGSKIDHFDHLERVLERLESANASLNPEKCIFGCEKGVLLGHIISKEGVAVDPEKVKKILELPFPINITKLRQFLGMIGYYRRFILSFSHKAHALTTYLKKSIDYVRIFGDEDALTTFEELKIALTSILILVKSNWNKPFLVYTDASNVALGCILSQNDEDGHDHPIAFASQQMVKAERNYSVTEREGLAVIFALKKFCHYLLGGKFTIITDHKALKYIFNKSDAEGRMARWKIFLSEYDFTILDRPGKKHANADLLSRAYDGDGEEPMDDTFSDEDLMLLSIDLVVPEEYQEIWDFITEGSYPTRMRTREKKALAKRSQSYKLVEGVLFRVGVNGVLQRAVGRKETIRLMQKFHDGPICGGHFAGKLTARKILDVGYHWNGIFKDCLDFCRTCDVCQTFATKSNVSTPLRPIPILGPFEKCGIDFVEPLNCTPRQSRYIVVATDYPTKWVEARPLSAINELAAGRFLYERIITRFGCPLELVSDRGGEFISAMTTVICNHFSITQRVTTSYMPRCNGLVERTNFTLCQMLAKDADMEGTKHNWDKRIYGILWEYRTTAKTSTGYSPFQLVYGLESKLPIQFDLTTFQTLQTKLKRKGGKEAEKNRRDELLELEETRNVAAQIITRAQEQQKKSYDKRLAMKDPTRFKEGDWVLVWDAIRHKRAQHKFLPRYFGPYLITKVWTNDTYDLEEFSGRFFDL